MKEVEKTEFDVEEQRKKRKREREANVILSRKEI